MSETDQELTDLWNAIKDRQYRIVYGVVATVISVVRYCGRLRVDLRSQYGAPLSVFSDEFERDWKPA